MKPSPFCNLLLLLAASSLIAAPADAASATWNLNPANGDWNNSFNWSPATVPNGPADIAIFGLSNLTNLFLSANTEVDGIVFDAAARAYTITARPTFTLTISGMGITNNSGIAQGFVADANGAGDFGTIACRKARPSRLAVKHSPFPIREMMATAWS